MSEASLDAMTFESATRWCGAIRRKEVSSLEALEHHVERVERLNGKINAVVALDVEAARERAKEADAALARGELWGPLHGLPMTIKDSYEVVGMPATCGIPDLAEHMPKTNATAVQRLLDAGCVVFGKTNTPLMASDFQSYNEVYGTTNNPWNVERVPGGSSGGAAAALAAGLTPLELGSDIGGSIRNPAHFCGVYGHKPSHAIIPMRGHVPPPPGALSEPDLSVAGPLARTPEDLVLALDVLVGPDEAMGKAWQLNLPAPRHRELSEYRAALWLDDPAGPPLSDEVRSSLESAADAIERAGVKVDRKARPGFDVTSAHNTYLTLLQAVIGAGLPEPVRARLRDRVAKLARDDHSLDAVNARGAVLDHRGWLGANEARNRLRQAWAEFFRSYDVVLCPVKSVPAFPHDHSPIGSRSIDIDGKAFPYFSQLFWAGFAVGSFLPATVIPTGVGASGLPVGLQIIGPYLEDRTTIRLARLLADVVGRFEAPPGFA